MFKVFAFDAKSLSWWRSQQNKIDMDPPYQRRGRLWSKTDKAFLIDSMLNDYDIPKFYIADFTFGDSKLNKKKLSYAIVDGKQRFEAVFDFYDGKIVLNDEFVFEEEPSLKLQGLGYADLKKNYPEIAEKYDNFNLSVMRVLADEEEKINELFIRLNRSKPLTGAEIRNAMTGPVPNMIREIAKHELMKSFIRFPITRGQDQNAAAKVFLFEFHKELHETKRKNLDKFVTEANRGSESKIEVAGRRVIDVFDRMTEIFLPKDKMLRSAGIFPVYYWFVRNNSPKNTPFIREFLVEFQRERKLNRNTIQQEGEHAQIAQDLVDFDKFNRSTDDRKSHSARYEILMHRYKRYLHDQQQMRMKIYPAHMTARK